MKHRCDKIWDCEGGEDELSCDNGCPNGGQFACRNQKECIAMTRYCDGVADCSDGSDEAPECRCHKRGQFACKRGGHCVSRYCFNMKHKIIQDVHLRNCVSLNPPKRSLWL